MKEENISIKVAANLGRQPTKMEMERAMPRARLKLRSITSREGTAGGKRLEPFYLAVLIHEAILESDFEGYTVAETEKAVHKRTTTTTNKLYHGKKRLSIGRNTNEIIEINA